MQQTYTSNAIEMKPDKFVYDEIIVYSNVPKKELPGVAQLEDHLTCKQGS